MSEAPAEPRISPAGLLMLFTRLSLIGFGGVMPWARRTLVEDKRLLSAEDFAEILALSQLLPGPTICNLAMVIGHRRGGIAGACAALAGLVVPPAFLVLGLSVVYGRIGHLPLVQDALRGMAVVTAAMVAAMAVQMARALPFAPRPVAFALAMFAGLALMHWPLLALMAGLTALSLAAVRWEARAKS